jgi:hypothetical protein
MKNKVLVKFADSSKNYTTSLNNEATEETAKAYFVGTWFNLAPYPKEEFHKCIGIEFTTYESN